MKKLQAISEETKKLKTLKMPKSVPAELKTNIVEPTSYIAAAITSTDHSDKIETTTHTNETTSQLNVEPKPKPKTIDDQIPVNVMTDIVFIIQKKKKKCLSKIGFEHYF